MLNIFNPRMNVLKTLGILSYFGSFLFLLFAKYLTFSKVYYIIYIQPAINNNLFFKHFYSFLIL